MMEFTFEDMPWERLLEKKPGSAVSALEFLTLTENESDENAALALDRLEESGIFLTLEGLPRQGSLGASALRLKQEEGMTDPGQLLQLEANDPLRLYMEELAAIPAAGDVQLLALELLEGRPVQEQLVNLSLSRVVELSLTMTGRGVLLLDLIQEGSLGLWQSLQSYAGGDFEVHRDLWIRQYLNRAVVIHYRSSGMLQKLRRDMEDYLDVDSRLLTELGRNPTIEEIARQLHMQPEEALHLEKMVMLARNMARVREDTEPQELTPEDEQAVEDTAYFAQRQRILELLSVLQPEEAQVLTLRFGLEGGLPLSPEHTGAKMGLTPQQVVELETRALAKLRREG